MFASLLATAEQLQSPTQSRASEASNISTVSMPAVQLGAGDAYLIMHLWELFPALGAELSTAVHSFRQYGRSHVGEHRRRVVDCVVRFENCAACREDY
jgi:hypothetical protein